MLIGLCKQTQRKSSNCIVTPRPKQCHKKDLAILGKSVDAKLSSMIEPTLVSRFRNLFRNSESSGAVIKLLFRFWTMMLANSTSFKCYEPLNDNLLDTAYLIFFQTIGESSINSLSTQADAQLADNEIASLFQ